jgi:hypothetical protein
MTTASGRYTIFNRLGHPHEAALQAVAEAGLGLADPGPWHYEPTDYDGGYGYRHTAGMTRFTPTERERFYVPFSPGFSTATTALADAERYEAELARQTL